MLLAVDGNEEYKDIIELREAFAEESLELTLQTPVGTTRVVLVEKYIDEDLGLEFAEAVFDGVRECHNNCKFCFVHHMPRGMRESLYVKDDDYRLSFLYGNFITLTNLTEQDMERIVQKQLSPLYISVHATDPQARVELMKHRGAGDIVERLEELAEHGVSFHTQIVLCPEHNDGAVLSETVQQLLKLQPATLSVAIVPVGLTKYRDKLPLLRTFTAQESQNIINLIEGVQAGCRRTLGRSFVYLADEFYINAGVDLPLEDKYDGFPQLENGIGLTRMFLSEWALELPVNNTKNFLIVTGTSAAKVLTPLLEEFNSIHGTQHLIYPQQNNFFGTAVNVTGLLTAGDIMQAIDANDMFEDIVLPAVCLRKGDDIFLDDVSLSDLRKSFPQKRIHVIANGAELKKKLCKGVS